MLCTTMCIYTAFPEVVKRISGHLLWFQGKEIQPSSPMFAHGPQTIWLGGCFIVLTVYFALNHWDFVLPTRLFRTANC